MRQVFSRATGRACCLSSRVEKSGRVTGERAGWLALSWLGQGRRVSGGGLLACCIGRRDAAVAQEGIADSGDPDWRVGSRMHSASSGACRLVWSGWLARGFVLVGTVMTGGEIEDEENGKRQGICRGWTSTCVVPLGVDVGWTAWLERPHSKPWLEGGFECPGWFWFMMDSDLTPPPLSTIPGSC